MSKGAVRSMVREQESLVVTYDQVAVGVVRISARSARKISGRFEPGPGFDICRDAFAEASQLARRFDSSHEQKPLDYQAFNSYEAVISRITQRVALPELKVGVKSSPSTTYRVLKSRSPTK